MRMLRSWRIEDEGALKKGKSRHAYVSTEWALLYSTKVVNCDFKLGGDRYLPMAFPEFVIILNEVPPTFNTQWDATGWPKSLQRSFYEKGVFGGIQKILRVCVHLFHRLPFNKLYDYNYPKYIFSRPHLLYLMSFQIKHEMSFTICTRPRPDSPLFFRTNRCFDYCTGK
jgi:hypothetical protein